LVEAECLDHRRGLSPGPSAILIVPFTDVSMMLLIPPGRAPLTAIFKINDVSDGSKADLKVRKADFRYTPENG
jgi:hypothetical protein